MAEEATGEQIGVTEIIGQEQFTPEEPTPQAEALAEATETAQAIATVEVAALRPHVASLRQQAVFLRSNQPGAAGCVLIANEIEKTLQLVDALIGV